MSNTDNVNEVQGDIDFHFGDTKPVLSEEQLNSLREQVKTLGQGDNLDPHETPGGEQQTQEPDNVMDVDIFESDQWMDMSAEDLLRELAPDVYEDAIADIESERSAVASDDIRNLADPHPEGILEADPRSDQAKQWNDIQMQQQAALQAQQGGARAGGGAPQAGPSGVDALVSGAGNLAGGILRAGGALAGMAGTALSRAFNNQPAPGFAPYTSPAGELPAGRIGSDEQVSSDNSIFESGESYRTVKEAMAAIKEQVTLYRGFIGEENDTAAQAAIGEVQKHANNIQEFLKAEFSRAPDGARVGKSTLMRFQDLAGIRDEVKKGFQEIKAGGPFGDEGAMDNVLKGASKGIFKMFQDVLKSVAALAGSLLGKQKLGSSNDQGLSDDDPAPAPAPAPGMGG